jgi:hypothetical protein
MSNEQLPLNNIDWAELYLVADSEDEPFAQVKLVSARSEFVESAMEQAVDIAWRGNSQAESDIKRIAASLIRANTVVVQENAVVIGDTAMVCIDGDVEAEDTRFRALDMIYAAIDAGGFWESGINLKFDVSELPELA